MNEDIQRYHSSFLVQEFVNNSINEEEFFTAIDNIQEELEVFEKIVSSLKPLLLQAKDKISNEEKQNQILEIIKKLESGNFLKSHIGILPSRVGEPTTYHEVPKQRLREFRGVFCDQILMIWERFGWSSFAKGLVWLVDPTIYDDMIKKLLKNTPYSEFDNYRVIARTAFGELILLGENTHTIVEIDLDSEGFSTLDHIRDLRSKVDKPLRSKMTSLATSFDKEYMDTVDSDGKKLFKKALKKFGELQSDEMYAFDSELPSNTWIEGVKDYKKVNIVEYLTKLQEISRLKYPQEEDKSIMENIREAEARTTASPQNIESNHSGNLDELLNKPELNHSIMEDILESEIQLFHKQQAPQQKEVLEKLLEKAKENYCLSPQFRQGIYFHILRGGNIPMIQTQDEFEALLGAYKELGNYSNYKEPSIIKQPLKTAFYFGENTDSDYPLSFINHTKLMALETGLSQLITSNLLVEHFILLADLSKDSTQCEYILEVFQGLDYKIQEEEFMLFMGLVSIVIQNEHHQQTLLKQIKGKAFYEKYHQDLATIISSGTNTSFSADSFSTIDSSSTNNNTPNTSIEIDEYFEFFLEKFGEPTQKIEATKEQIEKYRGVLPQKLLEYWESVGFSSFKDGLFWITNPDEFTYTVEDFLEDTPLEEYDKYHVIGRSAYGTLYLWGERTGDSLEIIPHLNWIKIKEGKEKDIKNGKEDMAIQRFFSVKNPKSVDVEDTHSNPLFPKIVQKYGALQEDEVMIFTPYLFFGGEASIDTVEKGNLDVFLSIFINMNQPEIVDMASMVQGVRKEYGE